MTARRVRFRQCDVERAIRAARATGAGRIMVQPDGTITIEAEPVDNGANASRRKEGLGAPKGVVL